MKYFETRYGAGVGQEIVQVQPYQEALWTAAFGLPIQDGAHTMAGLFDLTTAVKAIPVLDEAIARFNHDPDSLRRLLAKEDSIGLRGNRMVFEQIRRTLAEHDDATISGVIDDA